MKQLTITLYIDPGAAVRAGKSQMGEVSRTISDAELQSLTADQRETLAKAEIARRAHRCPICATLQVQLDEVAGALGVARMDAAGGYHYEAVSQLVRERDHYAKACVAAMRGQDPPWLDELTTALGWQGGTAVEAIHAVKRLVRAAMEQADLRKAEAVHE